MQALKRVGTQIGAVALALVLSGCGNMNRQPHPLVGRIWDASAQRFVSQSTLMESAAAARFVLLGEIHDDPEHHRIQTLILEEVLERGRRPALVMEQYDRDQEDSIRAVRSAAADLGDRLRGLGKLMRTSWNWPDYRPLVQLALAHDLPLAPANMARAPLRKVARGGFAELGEGEPERLALDAAWSAPRQARLIDDVRQGHCGKLPEHVVEPIAKSQRVRDAIMADVVLSFAEPGAVAILGNGHVRRDMGVPIYLQARAPSVSLLSVGLVQVNAVTDPNKYATGALGQRFDYIWFTPASRRAFDPCDSIPAPAAPK